jgi:hypothetical protein
VPFEGAGIGFVRLRGRFVVAQVMPGAQQALRLPTRVRCVVGVLAVVLFRRALARVQLPEFLELVAAASSSAMVTVPMVVLSISWPPSQKDAAGETRSIV